MHSLFQIPEYGSTLCFTISVGLPDIIKATFFGSIPISILEGETHIKVSKYDWTTELPII